MHENLQLCVCYGIFNYGMGMSLILWHDVYLSMLLDIVDTHRLLCFSRWCPAKFTAHYDLDLGATRGILPHLKTYYLQQKQVPDFFFKRVSHEWCGHNFQLKMIIFFLNNLGTWGHICLFEKQNYEIVPNKPEWWCMGPQVSYKKASDILCVTHCGDQHCQIDRI